MKSLGDAIVLRNRLIEHLEEAGTDCAEKDRAALLTSWLPGADSPALKLRAASMTF